VLALFYANFGSGFQLTASPSTTGNKHKRTSTYPLNSTQQENHTMKTARYTKSLTVSLRPEVYDQVKQITDEKHISIGEWVRDAIETALSTIQPKEETMR
jgi:predicted HicB family RNase H-like nuclease